MLNKNVAIVGAGVIGIGWAKVFSRKGWKVVITDPVASMEEQVKAQFPDGSVSFIQDLALAVKDVSFVQENAPERLNIKKEIFSILAKETPKDAILASSSSSIVSSKFSEGNSAKDRILIGHPFNPVDIMPLVEVVPHKDTKKEVIESAIKIYTELGQEPILIRKEIGGFVGNRLQVALNNEAIYLAQQGVITVGDLDRLVKSSLGLRWATVGPFEGMSLGGGPQGISHLFSNVGAGLDITLGKPDSSIAVMSNLVKSVNQTFGTGEDNWKKSSEKRDKLSLEILEVRKKFR